jgi:hypothetical protein
MTMISHAVIRSWHFLYIRSKGVRFTALSSRIKREIFSILDEKFTNTVPQPGALLLGDNISSIKDITII